MDSKHVSSTRFVKATTYSLIILGIIYIGLVAWGLGTRDIATGEINDEIRIAMEIGTMLTAIVFLLFAVSVHQLTDKANRTLGVLGVLFMLAMVILTSLSHFVSISVGSSLMNFDNSLDLIFSLGWPSMLLSIDILAWDFFFGLAFISLCLSLLPNKTYITTSILMLISGILSLLGLIAVPMNDMNVRFLGIFGYTVMPTLACISLLVDLRRIRNLPRVGTSVRIAVMLTKQRSLIRI
jgi:hypothetical protein